MGKGTSLIYCDRTDIGRRRSNNQDSKAVLPPSGSQQYRTRGWLFIVADGMGAHAAGEEASRIAAERVPLVYEKLSGRSPPLALRRSIEQTNAEINAKGEGAAEFKGMGTTCTTLAILPRGALVGHIGDSRAYRIRGTTIDQLSRDHSLVWELESSGGLTREQAAGAAPKNIITRSMGPHAQVEVDLEGPFAVEKGDVFLLCSDGLSGQVTDEEIGLVTAELEPREAADALIGLALVRGAPDNVTIVIARAGPEEVSKTSSSDEPWPLSDEPVASKSATNVPWKWLAISGASLFAALVLFPKNELWKNASELVHKVCMFGMGVAILSFIGSLLAAILGFLIPPAADGRVLPLGRQLGKGPYRSYSCAPSEPLLEGILGSIEAAADGLGDAERERTITILARARQNVAVHSFHEAMVAAAEALAIYKRSIEHSRLDQTAGGR